MKPHEWVQKAQKENPNLPLAEAEILGNEMMLKDIGLDNDEEPTDQELCIIWDQAMPGNWNPDESTRQNVLRLVQRIWWLQGLVEDAKLDNQEILEEPRYHMRKNEGQDGEGETKMNRGDRVSVNLEGLHEIASKDYWAPGKIDHIKPDGTYLIRVDRPLNGQAMFGVTKDRLKPL